ncbi:FtsH protease activity modulator HflK [Sphingomonas sp. LY54]|uniref:FtsH protease activity modulator HflK n=1 Tax=Sphingomonas sp. LY54 TaxID=3095343 RepID=UPI002D776FA9|nr:FtsH protease activity modulator HflK [Sphingomonas sp. LY54]WRP29876.1 FtsH protease activity modulator HflK [Sphingomonas sp. LY54]
MNRIFGWGARLGAMLNENRGGPWGGGSGGSGGSGGDGGGPRNPWGQPPRKRRPGAGGNVTSLDEFLKKSREKFGGGGGGRFPATDGKPYWLYGLGIFLLLWVLFTSVHRIGPQEQGVITRLGSYSGTLMPGIGFSLPAPIDRVQKVDVQQIRTIDIGSTDRAVENLILTGDQNIIDLAYSVRWTISDPELYLFRIANPEETIREVAESAMRAVVAGVSLDDAIGAGRSEVEQRVEQMMQQLLNDYGAGVRVQGVAIKQSDPPAAVNDAFKEVSAAQQQAQSYMNDARAYALQLTAKAQGEATAFDKVYAEYKLAPEVTRKRMYYETMEKVLSKVDKTIIEAPGVTPYLALPEVARRQQQQQPQTQEGAAR